MSQAAHGYSRTMPDRRRRKLPIWRVYWQQLTVAQKERIKSIAWAVSFHLFVVAVLAAISIATPQLVSIDLEYIFDSSSTEQTITMLADIAQELPEEELQVLEEKPPEIIEPYDALTSLEVAFDPTVPPTKLGSELASDLSAIEPPSSILEMQGDAQRIAETNRRVAAAGGKLQGPMRISLIFSGDDDIDLHVQYQEIGRLAAIRGAMFPYHIFFQNPRTLHAMLDVDANATQVVPEPCENVIFKTIPKSGNYVIAIHHYLSRGNIEPTPYVVVVSYGGKSKVFKGTILPTDGLMRICQFKHPT